VLFLFLNELEEMKTMLIGALESGGTKMVVAIGNENGEIIERKEIKTTTVDETMSSIADYFRNKNIDALGIGSFGPIDLDKNSKTYGFITSTPKEGWENTDILGFLKRELNVPCGFDTDVNASVLGEATYGCLKGLSDCMYITIGTGIGAGIISGGKLLHGMLHAEAGHIFIEPEENDRLGGFCPYHNNCFEGLASGPAIEKKFGRKCVELYDRKEVWELEAKYIAKALVNFIMVLSPKRIVLGGGVMHNESLMPLIRENVSKYINGYLKTKELEELEKYIVLPSLKDNQGIMGCIKLGIDATFE